jgi:hypothetical protein
MSLIFGQYTVLIGLGVFFVIVFAGIYLYFKTYGYTLQTAWDRLKNSFKKKEQIDINLTEDGKTEAAASLVPPPPEAGAGRDSKELNSLLAATGLSDSTGPTGSPSSASSNMAGSVSSGLTTSSGSNIPFSPEDRPSGFPGAEEKPGFATKAVRSLANAFGPDKEVFNVSRNIYTYDEAAPVCKALGAELATFDQVQTAQRYGADWCNYGWTKGQMAVFPTSEETWNKLQTGPKEYRFSCGKPGVNGGYFDNPELRFGVNCFGPRPEKKDTDELLFDSEAGVPPTAEQVEFDKKVQKFRDQLGNITVLPWSRDKWNA